MAEYLHFSRDSRLYMEKDGYLWSIPVLDGFSFSQATNASEITLNEMEDSTGRSRRGRKMFTDSLSAAEWSFSTYIRPFKSAGVTGNLDGGAAGAAAAIGGAKKGIADSTATHHHAVEEALWVAMAGRNVYTATTGKYAAPTSGTPTGGAISRFTLSGTTEGNGGAAGTYTFNVSNSSLGGTTTGASTNSSTGANAVITLTLTDDGSDCDVTATISERGTGWISGETITIAGTAFTGGASTADDVTITVQSESAHSDATDLDINFYDSSRASLGTFNLYYVFSDRTDGRLIYKLKDAVVNEASIDFDIDGIVYKVNDFELQRRLGNAANAPRWAIAHKFSANSGVSKILNIEIQIGRTGALTPVAKIKPINIGGVIVSNATLHNEEEIIRKDIRIDDTVVVERAGDVIPHVVSVHVDKRNKNSKKFNFPKKCPCGFKTIKEFNLVTKKYDAVRRCINDSFDCEKIVSASDILKSDNPKRKIMSLQTLARYENKKTS